MEGAATTTPIPNKFETLHRLGEVLTGTDDPEKAIDEEVFAALADYGIWYGLGYTRESAVEQVGGILEAT